MNFVFKLSEQEGQIVLTALRKEPYGLVVDLIDKIQSQAIEQRKQQDDKQ
jgi:hypothetical protein